VGQVDRIAMHLNFSFPVAVSSGQHYYNSLHLSSTVTKNDR